ncbi:MAG TPA: hypothetical protein VHV50_06130 [Actinomycetota bacterium]|nr:hypothetical protein [Actinomycetota bacterium]
MTDDTGYRLERSVLGHPAVPVVMGWLTAALLFAGSVMTLLLSNDITAPALPPPPAKPNLLTSTVVYFANERQRWTQEVVSTCLFAAGFVALAGLAVFLSRRHGAPDLGGTLMVVPLSIGAALGVGSALLSLGAEQAALDPHICDCKYSSTQIISQGRGLILANNSASWMLYGFFALAAVAFAVGALSAVGVDLGRGWRYLAEVIAVLFVVGLVASVVGASTLNDIIVGIGGGILLPVWAIWTGRKVRLSLTGNALTQAI